MAGRSTRQCDSNSFSIFTFTASSIFISGGDTSWATPVTTYADFANFSVSDPNQSNPPQLTIIPAGTNVIPSWPANGTSGYVLESSATIGPSNTGNVSSNPSIAGDQFTVTNAVGW
jgi:hypothetical protein